MGKKRTTHPAFLKEYRKNKISLVYSFPRGPQEILDGAHYYRVVAAVCVGRTDTEFRGCAVCPHAVLMRMGFSCKEVGLVAVNQ